MNEVKLNFIIGKCQSFKIGKTSMPLEDRRNEPDYRDVYTHIDSVDTFNNFILASVAEANLIDACISHPKCDNVKDGDQSLNDHMGTGSTYQVYIVWR